MSYFDKLVDAVAEDEGFRAVLYDDATGKPLRMGDTIKGNPTIGYGWNVADSPMSKASGRDILVEKIILAQRDASELISNWSKLDDVRKNVITNMSYNLGKTRLAKFVKFLAAVNEARFTDAAYEMKHSAWYGQVGKRAARLTSEMLTGWAE